MKTTLLALLCLIGIGAMLIFGYEFVSTVMRYMTIQSIYLFGFLIGIIAGIFLGCCITLAAYLDHRKDELKAEKK